MYKMAHMKYSNKTESKCLEKAKSPGTGVYLMQFIHSFKHFLGAFVCQCCSSLRDRTVNQTGHPQKAYILAGEQTQ